MHPKVHSSIIYNSQDMEATEVSIDRATVKMYKGMPLAIKKKNDILPFSTTRMNLEGIMLSEIIRERKTNTICYHLDVESKKIKQTSEYNNK